MWIIAMKITYKKLESLYAKYNKYCYIHPDPLEFVYSYKEDRDREIAGLLSSSLAYGNVKQILKSVSIILDKMNPSPYAYIVSNNLKTFAADFQGFKHRFTTDSNIVNLLCGIKNALEKFGSLKECFASEYHIEDKNIIPALIKFTENMSVYFPDNKSYLLPSPKNGSACKRLMLYLRWMIRKDEVDPGCWNNIISPSKLIIPLDTHMHQISKIFGYTKRKSADLKTAVEITKNFVALNSSDPTKYDFVLTRFGIRDELSYKNISQ